MSDKQNDNERRQSCNYPQPPTPHDTPATENKNGTTDHKISALEDRVSTDEKGMRRWTIVIAFFTMVSAASTFAYVYCFRESERAFLLISDLSFLTGEPTTSAGGSNLRMVIKNYGRHIATVKEMRIIQSVGVTHKTLPELPDYTRNVIIQRGIPPIPPDGIAKVGAEVDMRGVTIPINDLVARVLSGTIPLWVYGFVDYNIGYPALGPGRLGFCFVYDPPAKRLTSHTFLTCENTKYTYAN